MKSVGERVQQARLERGMTAEALAKAVGYRWQSSIGNIESRMGGQGAKKLPDIARVLGVPLQWLIEGPDSLNVPFITPSSAPIPLPTAPNYKVQEPPAPDLVDASMQEAMTLFRLLDTEQRLEVIHHMRRLTGRPASPRGGSSEDGDDNPISGSKAA